jgi:gamma-glutamyltranspeptidase
MALGSPRDCIFTVPQVLLSILEYEWDPYPAIDAPRFWPLKDDWTIEVENRIPKEVISDLKKIGIMPRPLGDYHWPMGSMQCVWKSDEGFKGTADPRRLGSALGY